MSKSRRTHNNRSIAAAAVVAVAAPLVCGDGDTTVAVVAVAAPLVCGDGDTAVAVVALAAPLVCGDGDVTGASNCTITIESALRRKGGATICVEPLTETYTVSVVCRPRKKPITSCESVKRSGSK